MSWHSLLPHKVHECIIPYSGKFSQGKTFVNLVITDFHGVKLSWVSTCSSSLCAYVKISPGIIFTDRGKSAKILPHKHFPIYSSIQSAQSEVGLKVADVGC